MEDVLIMTGMLAVLSAEDIRKKRIPAWMLAAYLSVCAGICIWQFQESPVRTYLVQKLISALPGILLFLLSVTENAPVGKADGLCLIGIGLTQLPLETIWIVCAGSLLAALFGMLLLILHRAGRRTRIPFIPFLSAGYLVILALTQFPG